MTRDTVPETCHPYGVRKEGGTLPLMSYKHVAPTELKAQAFATFLKVFDLLIMIKSQVLRKKDFDTFSLEEAFSLVREIGKVLESSHIHSCKS